MKILTTSDLHYGFGMQQTRKILQRFFEDIATNEQDIDLVLIAGDIQSDSCVHLEKLFKMYREILPTTSTAVVFGNHDYWETSRYLRRAHKKIEDIFRFHNEVVTKYSIHYLQDNPIETDKLIIYGFDGWYAGFNPDTNDKDRMPFLYPEKDAHAFMRDRADKAFDKILLDVDSFSLNKKKMLVTHFPSYSINPIYQRYCANQTWFDFITEKFDYYVVGHSHQRERFLRGSCEIINSGSDYNNPKYQIINV